MDLGGDDQPRLLKVTAADLCCANEPEHAKNGAHGRLLEPVSTGLSLVLLYCCCCSCQSPLTLEIKHPDLPKERSSTSWREDVRQGPLLLRPVIKGTNEGMEQRPSDGVWGACGRRRRTSSSRTRRRKWRGREGKSLRVTCTGEWR